jgi:hypothetical protein
MPIEDGKGAGVEGVSAQLVAGKPRAIEHPHRNARARQHQRGQCARWTRPDDQNLRGSHF